VLADERHDPAPLLRTQAPDRTDALLARAQAFEEELNEKYEEGEITGRELREGLKAAAEKREEVNWANRKAELADEMQRTAAESAWNTEVERFIQRVTVDPESQRLSDRAQLAKARKLYQDDVTTAAGLHAASTARQPTSHGDERDDMGSGEYAALDRLPEHRPIA
jgi:hypothetical protein